MTCVKCGGGNIKVLDSRRLEKRKIRRRECKDCFARFSTVEVYRDEWIRFTEKIDELINEFIK